MTRIEELVRDSLRQRAEDVEPTPALWREVDRRIARRRRLQVTTWSLAAVAAAVAAFVVVPGLLGGSDPSGLEIEPMGPTGGVVPTLAVVSGQDGLGLLELTSGAWTPLGILDDGEVTSLTVRPGSTADDFDLAVVQRLSSGGSSLSFAFGRRDAGTTASSQEYGDTSFVPSVRWSPDGRSIAYTEPTDGRDVELWTAPAPTTDDGSHGFLDPADATLVTNLPEGSVVLDWVLTARDGISEVWVRHGDGTVGVLPIETTGPTGEFAVSTQEDPFVSHGWGGGDEETTVTDVAAAVGADPTTPNGGLPTYLLAPGTRDGPSLFWSGLPDQATGLSPVVEVPLDTRVGDADLDGLWLDAEQDAALVGDGQQTWWFAHDGDGDFAPPVELPGVTAAALFDAPRPAADDAADDGPEELAPVEDGDPEPRPIEPGTGADDVTGGAPGLPAALAAPIVTVSAQELTLIGPAGSTSLVTLGGEGMGRFLAAQVRPGSTPDDLTVVALTTAEGVYDLRHLHYVDGEVVTWEAFEPPHSPGFGGSAGEGASIWGPVWSPEGEHLAWFEWGTGPATLRTIGWADGPGTGDTATDNASFALDVFGVTPLVPVEWVSVAGNAGRTEIRAYWPDSNQGWFGIPLEIQDDGAVALIDEGPVDDWATPWEIDGAATAEGVAAAFATDGAVDWLLHLSRSEGSELIRDPGGAVERFILPEDLGPDDGLPAYVMRAVGPDVIVGSRDTGTAYLVTGDGEFLRFAGDVLDADIVD